MNIDKLIDEIVKGKDVNSLLEMISDIPEGVKPIKVKRSGFTFLIWEKDNEWFGMYQMNDTNYSEIKPSSMYGYSSMKELMKELVITAKYMWKNVKGSRSPYYSK